MILYMDGERFGEYNDNTFLRTFIEGSWMNKHNEKYYLQYGAPGTEFSGYGDWCLCKVINLLDHLRINPHNPFP